MRKNRLMWNIVLFLIIIVAIPRAYAQAFTGSSWFFILINSAIVGVMLFVLQSFLIHGKDNKEKPAVWVAIIVGSLVIGFLFGSQGYIWQHPVMARFFSWYVLVNAIVIGTALYFLSGFLDIQKRLGGNPEGKGGLGILIFLIAAIFAVQIGNQWIWQKAVVQQFIDYLFGTQGILNPAPPEYRLWAFLAVTTLLSFFFKGYLLPTGAGGTDKVNYALAILIGTSVARAGISFASIVLLGEAIFTIVLAKALQGTAPQPRGIPGHWILAGFLVGWASAAMTYGTEYQGGLATIVGYPLWVMGWVTVGPTGAPAQPTGVGGWFGWIAKMGGGALIVLLLIPFVFLFIISRSQTIRERRKRYKGIRNAYILNILADLTKKAFTSIPGLRTRFMRLRNIKDREPEIVYRNRLLFMRLLDQELRFDIFYTKYLYMKDFAKLLQNETINVSKFKNQEELKKLILSFRSQKGKIPVITKDPNSRNITTREIGEEPVADMESSFEEYKTYMGWNYMNKILILYMNDLLKFLLDTATEIERSPTGRMKPDDNQFLRTIADQKISADIAIIDKKLKPSYEQYKLRLENYKHHHIIKAYTTWIWDMFNLSFNGVHPYRFAKKGARYLDNDGRTTGIIENDTTEVDEYGEFADDLREVIHNTNFEKNVKDERIRIRRLKNPKKDSVPFPPKEDMGKIAEYYLRDWESFIRDFRIGLFHPHSRSVNEYLEAWKKGIWSEDKIDWIPRGGSENSPAFDLRILANPGTYSFSGREKYDSPEEQVIMDNVEPHMSQFGIKQFILRLIEKTDAQMRETEAFLSLYPADTEQWPQELKDQKEKGIYTVGRFETKSEK